MCELEKCCLVSRNKRKQRQNFETWVNVNKWLKEKIGIAGFFLTKIKFQLVNIYLIKNETFNHEILNSFIKKQKKKKLFLFVFDVLTNK